MFSICGIWDWLSFELKYFFHEVMFPNRNIMGSDSTANLLAASTSIFSTQVQFNRELSHLAMIKTIKDLVDDWNLSKMGPVLEVWMIVWLKSFKLLLETHNLILDQL